MASYCVLFVFSVIVVSFCCVDAKHPFPEEDVLSRMKRKDETPVELSRVKRLENDPSSLSRVKRLEDAEHVKIRVGEPPHIELDEKTLARVKRMKRIQHDETPSLVREKRLNRDPSHKSDDEKASMKHYKEERPSLRSDHLKSKGYGVHSSRREEHLRDDKDKIHHYKRDKILHEIHEEGKGNRFHPNKQDREHYRPDHLDRKQKIKDKRSAMPRIYKGDEGHNRVDDGDANFEARLKAEGYLDAYKGRNLPEKFLEKAKYHH